jgi:hypothetical protein
MRPFLDRRFHNGSCHSRGAACGPGASGSMTGGPKNTPCMPSEGHLNGSTDLGGLRPAPVPRALKTAPAAPSSGRCPGRRRRKRTGTRSRFPSSAAFRPRTRPTRRTPSFGISKRGVLAALPSSSPPLSLRPLGGCGSKGTIALFVGGLQATFGGSLGVGFSHRARRGSEVLGDPYRSPCRASTIDLTATAVRSRLIRIGEQMAVLPWQRVTVRRLEGSLSRGVCFKKAPAFRRRRRLGVGHR